MPDRKTTPQARRLPRAVREPQMLDAAVEIFSRSGFHAASMEEIARRAGVSKPMIYLYFGGKEDLFSACLRREGARLLQAIVDAVAPWQPAPPDEQLWRGLHAFFRSVGTHRDGWSVLNRQARAQQPFASELAAMRARMVEVLTGLLRRAVSAPGAPGTTGAVPEQTIEILAVTLVGAAESVADWVTDQPGADAGTAATRVMDIVWLGTRDLLRGATWHPAGADGSQG